MRDAIGAVLAMTFLGAGSASALKKHSARIIDPYDDWSASTTLTLRYYNNCTGWFWVWSGWSPGETVGVNFDAACAATRLNVVWTLTLSGAPAGYGFTGTISVLNGQGCAAPAIASQPYLPPATSGWNATAWGGFFVPNRFSVLIAWGAPSGFTNTTGFASDHPLAGPTGPAACGTCFPTTRASHSRYYGVAGAYCPSGTTLGDGLCDVEFMLDASIKCHHPVGVEHESWGSIKALYR